MAVNRVRVIWTGSPTVGDGLSTFYFDSLQGTAAQQVTAVATFLDSTETSRVDNMAWSTESDVATLNITTGQLEGITSTTSESGLGTSITDQMPPAAQGLLRLFTSQIVNGRLLRGRLFLPGASESFNTAGGIPDTVLRSDYEAAAAALIADSPTAWCVWSITHGVLSPIVSASVWTKWAMLRSRRD